MRSLGFAKYWIHSFSKACLKLLIFIPQELQDEGEEIDEALEDEFYMRRLDAGLFTLQLIDCIIMEVCSSGVPSVWLCRINFFFFVCLLSRFLFCLVFFFFWGGGRYFIAEKITYFVFLFVRKQFLEIETSKIFIGHWYFAICSWSSQT